MKPDTQLLLGRAGYEYMRALVQERADQLDEIQRAKKRPRRTKRTRSRSRR